MFNAEVPSILYYAVTFPKDSESPKVKRSSILILDDFRADDTHLHDALSEEHTLVWARNISEAMNLLHLPDSSFDLVICGVHLERESMFDFLRGVKSQPQTRTIPFLCFRCGNSDFARACDAPIEKTSRLLGAAGYIAIADTSIDPLKLRGLIEAVLCSEMSTGRGRQDA